MSIASALKAFEGARVLVIGDIILDIYIYGSVDRISPEAPIPILNHKHTRHALGGAANVAANLKGLGAEVHLVSITGEDDEADFLTTMLDLEEINHDLIRLKNRPTTSKSRVISGSHQLLRIDHETTLEIDAEESDLLSGKITEVIQRFQPAILVLEDYNKGMMNSTIIARLNQLTASSGIPVVVDPKKNHFFAYTGCTLFKPNFKECAQQMPFSIKPELESLQEADRYLRALLKNKYTMITLAEHGIFISDGQKSLIVPTEIRKVSDVSGAGDTVTAIATFGVIQALSLESIASLANIAAGLVCSKPGVYAIRKEELIQNNN
ncbi:MAG: bifunctional ADP-heptose synthase [Saprospiraceae bacterium]|nr:bifunctional ADP-heptose synthase [Saprospiraceae bacterium]